MWYIRLFSYLFHISRISLKLQSLEETFQTYGGEKKIVDASKGLRAGLIAFNSALREVVDCNKPLDGDP